MNRICRGLPSHFCTVSQFAFVIAVLGAVSSISLADDGEPKKALDHSDYDRWHTITSRSISPDGEWILYSVQSGEAEPDPTIVIKNLSKQQEYSILRGRSVEIGFDSRFAAYQIEPDPKVVKQLKKAKASADKMPGTKLEVLELQTGDHFIVDRVKSFAMPRENGRWIAFLMEAPIEAETVKAAKADTGETYEVTPEGLQLPRKAPKLKKREELQPPPLEPKESEPAKTASKPAEPATDPAKEKTSEEKKKKAPGTFLVLRDLETNFERRFPDVVNYVFSKNGATLAFSTSVKQDDKKPEDAKPADDEKSSAKKPAPQPGKEPSDVPTDGVYVFDLEKLSLLKVISGTGTYEDLAFNEDGSKLAFLTDKDDYQSKTSSSALYLWQTGSKTAGKIAEESTREVPKGWWISTNAVLQFSEDNRRLFFATTPVPEDVVKEREAAAKKAAGKKDDDEEEPKAKLDLWHWQDPLLQPQQLLQAERERRRDYRAAYDLRTKKLLQLATHEVPDIAIDPRSKSDIAVATSDLPYRKSLSWDTQGFQDTYFVNLKTGTRELVLENSRANPRLSPEGKFVTWWDGEQKKWFSMSTAGSGPGKPIEISAGINFPLDDELHDTPSLPGPYGSGEWLAGDSGFLIYDRFDIWKVDPKGESAPVCVTGGSGRESSVRFRLLELDREQRAFHPQQPIMLSAFNEKTKASGFYRLLISPEKVPATGADASASADAIANQLQSLIMLDEQLAGLTKAKLANNVIFTRSSFRRCPDLWSSTPDFKKISRVSDINPQQDEYRWGTAELVQWKSADGQLLDGLLYKPDDFDPEQKYPLMVYFYERNSDTLHTYYTPAAGRSIINHSFYVSRGYLLFVPDIPYTIGEPGQSAFNSVVPGVQSLIARGFVDEKRIGMQGHSWGGYQTAYLVTQTDMFACAESGAPVSNMTSAYGGIRWSSGMSRMFQYERTQSRIGEDLWSAREKYIANSPLFFADKVHTPILILHNDEDGAVPWYQGIEYFVALRRLGKPAWLLNYNGDPHWVMSDANRRDFATRMQQFFDYYLMDAPEPEWMAVGIPAVDKGKKFGLELLEPEQEASPEPEPAGAKK